MKKFLAVLAATLIGCASASAFTITNLTPTGAWPDGRLQINKAFTVISNALDSGSVSEAQLVTPATDGLNAKRSFRVAFTASDLAIGSNNVSGVTLPDNAVIDSVIVDVTSVIQGTNTSLTFTIGTQADVDSLYAGGTNAVVGLVAGVPVGTAGTAVKTTAATPIYFNVATGAASNGAGVIMGSYYVSD